MTEKPNSIVHLPLLPIRDRVVFPLVHAPLVVGRPRSIQAVQNAFAGNRFVFVAAQRNVRIEDPTRDDMYGFGTVSEILQILNMPDGIVRTRVIGRYRAKLLDLTLENGMYMVDVQPVEIPSLESEDAQHLEALRRMVIRKFDEYSKKSGRIPLEISTNLPQITSLDLLADTIADAILVSMEEKQELVELVHTTNRLSRLVEILDSEIEILNIQRKIELRVHRQIEKNQKEYYLNEQMRAIQKELKRKDDNGQEVDEMRRKLKDLKLPAESEELVLKEVDRLDKMMPFSPEATVIRSYLEWVLALPWQVYSKDSMDVKAADKILSQDHFGLEKPKERLLEYLAVLKLTQTIKGPILCFVGPPGVGKTSLAKSLARSMGRQFFRISLGGVRDESEIRGHRRTYIGSMPGRIIQSLRKCKTKNPVILLDEVDKMTNDWRGDPAAGLLEVLDPEQNKTFVDNYLDIGFDLSKVIFIATANSLYSIPPTLIDRMEIIRFSAYTIDEKVKIAQQFLLPKEIKEHGFQPGVIKIDEEALRKIIHIYTQEAGVRELGRKIAKICRKVAVEFVQKKDMKKSKTVQITMASLATYLGVPEYIKDNVSVNSVGVATGLAYTDHGGETLTIEVTTMPGQGKIILTGKLGEVMKESAQTAFSLFKSRSEKMRVRPKLLAKQDMHIHIPEGAVPKDGPSAGIALATAIASVFTGMPVKKDLAMTGEVTLRGRVLPIGGLKEKVLAAFRDGMKEVLFPKGNEKDLAEIPENIRNSIKLIPVEMIDDVFRLALVSVLPKSVVSSRKQISLSHPN